MNIQVYKSEQQLNEAAARTIIQLLQAKPNAVLGLATGGTPVGIYRLLVEAYQRGEVSFSQASSFNLDEYVGIPEDHSESYRTYMNSNLFKHVDLPAARALIPDGNAGNLQQECERYEQLQKEAGQTDLQLLGLGHNGHIGFNEPGPTLQSRTNIVTLDEKTREANARFFASIDEVPTQAITMGMSSIMYAKTILLVVKGADKADIVRQALTGPITTECPASLLQTHAGLVVMLDEAAASLL